MFRKKKTVVLCLRPPQNRTFHVVVEKFFLTFHFFYKVIYGENLCEGPIQFTYSTLYIPLLTEKI